MSKNTFTVDDLKKGTPIKLRNGWRAVIKDNRKGSIRNCTVYGDYTETGSVYSHDIVGYVANGKWHKVKITPLQQKVRKMTKLFGFGTVDSIKKAIRISR